MNKADIQRAVENLRDQGSELLQRLVRIPSVTGNEAAAQRAVSDYLHGMKLQVDQWIPSRSELEKHPAFSDDGLPLENRPVVVGRWPGNNGGASLILNGHIDVVPPGDKSQWEYDPWSGKIHKGSLYGRGACDMKGGLVAGILAIQALQQLNFQPARDIVFQSVIGEESGGAGTLACVVRGYRAEAAIILEPTSLRICPVGAGAATFRLRVPGLAAHGAMREEGINAIDKFYVLLQAIQRLEEQRNSAYHHPLYQEGAMVAPISIGKINAGDWPSTVCDWLVAEGRYGVFPGETIEQARASFEQSILRSASEDGWLREHPPAVEWFEGQFESAETPPDSPVVQQLASAHAEILGIVPRIHGVSYGSDLRFFVNNANTPAVLYGPGDVVFAHSVKEHVVLQEMLDAAKVLALMIVNWEKTVV